jgi:hypothetical protein
MNLLTHSEIKQVKSDCAYWKQVGALIDCDLHGFTERKSGSFLTPSGQDVISIPGWLAERIIKLGGSK